MTLRQSEGMDTATKRVAISPQRQQCHLMGALTKVIVFCI